MSDMRMYFLKNLSSGGISSCVVVEQNRSSTQLKISQNREIWALGKFE